MKNILLAIFVALLLAACSDKGYKIQGRFNAAPDGTVVYMLVPDTELTVVDSAIISGGRFEFSGGYHTRTLRMLLVNGMAVGGPVVLEPGRITINFGAEMSRGGTDGNEILQKYVSTVNYLKKIRGITSPEFLKNMPIDKNMLDSLVAEREVTVKALALYADAAIEGNIDNELGLYILSQSYDMLPLLRLKDIVVRVPLFLRDERYQIVCNYLEHRLTAANKRRATAVGRQYENFELPDIDGKKALFSATVEKHSYTLLQFWASWCAPCRAELPSIEEVYKKYGGSNFAVVGVSLDSDTSSMRTAVVSLGLTFPLLASPQGGSGEVAAAYGIDEIPANILINNRGVIIARNISPDELSALLGGDAR